MLRDKLNKASENLDVIITSGGASAGDEDHLAAILSSEGQVTEWRIAIKPGDLWRWVFGMILQSLDFQETR